ncbi:helix-turn-helix domain-containing protein [Streptomyces sp. NPDC048484]|uniref:helix-turn-helix domain-containing protein n=1 Tax=Streptomyces sp. NPDC048484 TaxID=3155146 RepID=UPI003433F329
MTSKQSPRTPTKPQNLDAPYFSVREVAWLLKCSYDTVRRRLAAGTLAYSQEMKGGVILISREDLACYYSANRPGRSSRKGKR